MIKVDENEMDQFEESSSLRGGPILQRNGSTGGGGGSRIRVSQNGIEISPSRKSWNGTFPNPYVPADISSHVNTGCDRLLQLMRRKFQIPYIYICANPKYTKLHDYYSYYHQSSSQITFPQLHALCQHVSTEPYKQYHPEKNHSTTMILRNCQQMLPIKLREEFLPEEIQFLCVFEIMIHNRKAGYLYCMDAFAKEEEEFPVQMILLMESFVESITVLLSKHHPTWLQEQAQNAELAIDLLHHIQYPMKRATAIANEIRRHASELKTILTANSTITTTTTTPLAVSRKEAVLAKMYRKIDYSIKLFKQEFKLLDDLMENSFQLHLLRSPHLSKISCEYDYILTMQNIPNYVQRISLQFFQAFKLKTFPIILDPAISDLNHIYMHTSLIWMTLYWCFFNIVFLPTSSYAPEIHLRYKDAGGSSDSISVGQGMEFTIQLIRITQPTPSVQRQPSLSSKRGEENELTSRSVDQLLAPIFNLATRKIQLLGDLSFTEINYSFKHFLTLFNVVIDRNIFEITSMPDDTSTSDQNNKPMKEVLLLPEEQEQTEQREIAYHWNIQLPLNIASFLSKKRSRSISVSEYSAKFRNHSIVHRNNSIDASISSQYSRKMKPSSRKSGQSSGSPFPFSDSISVKTTPDPTALRSKSGDIPTRRLTFGNDLSIKESASAVVVYSSCSPSHEFEDPPTAHYASYFNSLAKSINQQDSTLKQENVLLSQDKQSLKVKPSPKQSFNTTTSSDNNHHRHHSRDRDDGTVSGKSSTWRQFINFFRKKK